MRRPLPNPAHGDGTAHACIACAGYIHPMTDSLSLLRLYVEWGADDALDSHPHDRLAPAPTIHDHPRTTQPPPIQAGAGNAHKNHRPPPPVPRGSAPLVEQAVAAAREAARGARTMADLHAAICAFEGCSLRETATHSVFVAGPEGAPLMLIGEAPDADEDRGGQPFAGESGALVTAMFGSIGINQATLLRAPVIPWRPPGGRPPSVAETRICLPFIQRAIVLARPARVVLMGNLPVSVLLGQRTTAARMRGRWRDLPLPPDCADNGATVPTIQALPMRHPLQLRASATARRDAWKDMLLIRETIGNIL
ncbi:uracil-DNA glycosylase [Komagataeibacter oboediens]|uniref:uracil-DNA glycosylase n=1 Tax=Komagataeibacter oboediens TaxID=65958 RepID=UPI001C2C8850|nr:uracil-DNA glycosylase [Komagataeibacter oboediens]MBV0888215.1 uracil-DNA glycosylase [Komagataeibacter oboediens]MCK9819753.1 uracil-DNA glycosylase [Komagataeibacter oboediens]